MALGLFSELDFTGFAMEKKIWSRNQNPELVSTRKAKP